MKLHEFDQEFHQLISIVARKKNISESAVERDYYIVMTLQKLEQSDYADKCVFKGGTSLSKCYPGSIERFSEDIDLTFLAAELGIKDDKACEKELKTIEQIMFAGAEVELVTSERNKRNKSAFVWYGSRTNQIKLEIGSTIRPDPYGKKEIKTYIQEYLEEQNLQEDVARFELTSVRLNVLSIERTFVDKVMAVKRHAICGKLSSKVRHIYDVVRLFSMPEIKAFLNDRETVHRLVTLTKSTDLFYLEKRNLVGNYNPVAKYDFPSWMDKFDDAVRNNYEHLHEELLYTDEKQDFDQAIYTFKIINSILEEIDE